MPFFAPFPVPTIMATGVASPKAQGQEMTRMEMPMEKANSKSAPMAKYHRAVTATAKVMTAGTKIPATASAIFAIGALLALASSTRRIIWLIVVSSPTRWAVT